MKKTQIIELFKNIKKTIVSYIAIMIFVLGATALFIGLSFGADSEKASCDAQMNAVSYRDLQLIFPYGITSEEIASLLEIDGVDHAEGYNNAYASFYIDEISFLANVISLTYDIDTTYHIEGNLPEKEGEIAIEASFANKNGIRIGDTIDFRKDDDGTAKALFHILNYDIENGVPEDLKGTADPDGMSYLTGSEYTVTALVEGAAYMDTAPASFGTNENTMQAVNCIAFVAPCSMDYDAFLGYRNVLIRSDGLRNISYFSDEYKNKLLLLEANVDELAASIALNKSNRILDKISAITENMERQYADAAQTIADAEKKLQEQSASVEELRTAQKMGIAAYDTILQEYDSSVEKIAKSKRSLTDSRQQIDDFAADTSEIEARNYTYMLSNESTNFQYILAGSEATGNMKFTFVGMFMVICLLVCYSSISRIVNDQITAIGTKKALGLTRREVSLSYILYTGSAALTGAIMGLVIGALILQKVIAATATGSYVFDRLVMVFDTKTAVILVLSEVLAVVLITYFSSASVLKKNAIRLLQGAEPPKGKALFFEKWQCWNRLPLFYKTVVKNTLHDKRRVAGTLIGITGCCALIIAALTMSDNMLGSLDRQFDDYYHFDTIVMFDGASDELEQALSEKGIAATAVSYSRILCDYPSGKTLPGNVFTPVDETAFKRLFTIKAYRSDEEKAYSGIWFCNSLKNACPDIQEIETQKFSGEKVSVAIDGFFVCHLNSSQIFMDKNAYTAYFGKEPVPNALLFNKGSLDLEELERSIGKYDSFRSVTDFFGSELTSFNTFSTLSTAMVSIFLIFSTVLAVMVLLTILSMYVQEKKTELIVLMINGYTLQHARRYIYSDTILLTVIGIMTGCAAGHFMGIMFIGSVESDAFYLMHDVDPVAMIVGIAGCALATFVMCLISLKKIDHFELTDINK